MAARDVPVLYRLPALVPRLRARLVGLVIVLTANSSGPKYEAQLGGRKNIGQLLSPEGWRRPSRRYWACDNDVFSHRSDPSWWEREGERNWLKMLDKVAHQQSDPMFVLLPDVVGDWRRTLSRAHIYLPEVYERDLRYAIALQDGCDFREALSLRPHTVFVGGTRLWKWLNAEAICRYFQPRGVKVHIGRASGPNRIRECLRLGVDSCDGTGWSRFSEGMLPGLWRELDRIPSCQMRMQL